MADINKALRHIHLIKYTIVDCIVPGFKGINELNVLDKLCVTQLVDDIKLVNGCKHMAILHIVYYVLL